MPVHAKCPCGKQYLAADKHRGRRARCPACGQQFYVCEIMLSSYTFVQSEQLPAHELFDPETKLPVTMPQAAPSGSAAQPSPVPAAAKSPAAAAEGHACWRDYLYWLPLLTLFPLALFLGRGSEETLKDRLKRTLKSQPVELERKVMDMFDDPTVTMDEILAAIPGNRLVDSHVPRDSQIHWLYGLAAAVGFGLLLVGMFRAGSANPLLLIGIAFMTGTVGIGMLLLAHEFLFFADLITAVAESPESSFTFSLIGFTLGVGIFEELAKAIPVIYFLYSGGKLTWRAGFLWGFASGLGFGISEGITYAGELYNGITSWEIYLVRFASCVALHAIWSASSGLLLARWQDHFEKVEKEWYDLIWVVLMAIGVPAVLHGAYDSMLTRDMYMGALMAGLMSFAWLAWLVEDLRRKEREAAAPQPLAA
jgi:RsiW-degrading membrane proteinase PrsW (M82 family)